MRYIFTLFIFCAINSNLSAQKILKLYRGDDKAYEFFIEDVVHIQLKNGEEFYEFQIADLDFEHQRIMIKAGFIDIKDIVAFKSYRYAQGADALSKGLYTFSAGWVFYSIIDILTPNGPKSNEQVAREGIIVGAGAFLSGYFVKRLLSAKVYPLDGKMYMLKIVDLDIQVPKL
jgi:hypothetical protein